ncbi:Rz-like spanin [Klebsiella phage vB_KpP_FBKp27]|uniref:Endopeptidase Rz n=1 Tax=Klebsiella phage vB_KpP_FBKp27 TaxID=2801837 RepID=A0A7U0GAH8_9CAUD|nr:Rz-like spanin [Klebsiella phage vB_KpP_FBKp27]QQV91637.1 endopeptidase Rz [Klebsiella phage vB_KpP_FBKp27]
MIKDLIKQYAVLLGSVLALVLLAGACYLTYVVTDNHWSAKYSGLEQKYSDASAKATQEARVKEWEYQNNVDAIAQQGAKDLAQARSDADSANASIGRLQQRINRLLADTSSEDSGTTQRGKTAREALDLLANVLEKSLERNRQLADYADKASSAGLTCEKAYDAIQSGK